MGDIFPFNSFLLHISDDDAGDERKKREKKNEGRKNGFISFGYLFVCVQRVALVRVFVCACVVRYGEQSIQWAVILQCVCNIFRLPSCDCFFASIKCCASISIRLHISFQIAHNFLSHSPRLLSLNSGYSWKRLKWNLCLTHAQLTRTHVSHSCCPVAQ